MPIKSEIRSISDSRRDAERHHRLLLALNRATEETRRMEREGHPDINAVLDSLLPDLAAALNAEEAFVAVLQGNEDGGKQWLELTTAHPRKDLRGHHLEWSELLHRLIMDGITRVIDPLGEEVQASIPGLEIFNATSAILVRMQAADHVRVIGICNKADPNRGPFLAADGMSLDIIVELLAAGARVGERRRRELEGIQRTSAAISAELDLDELLPMIARGAAEVFNAPATSLMLWDKAEENLVIVASEGLSDEYVLQQRIPKERVYAAPASNGEIRPLVTSDLRLNPFGRPDLIQSERLCSVLNTPLLMSGQLIGVLNIYSKDRPRAFSSDEIELAEIFANQAAIAIQNAQLRRRELESLLVTSGAIRASLDLDLLLTLIISKASGVFGAPATSLMLWDEAEEKLVIMASEGLSDEYVLQQRIPKEKAYAAAALNGRFHTFVTPDLRFEPLGQPELYEKERLCTALSTPLLVSDRLIGVLNIYSKDAPREFTPDEIELAAIFANQAAIAIEVAQLHQQTRQRGGQLAALDQIALDIAKQLETKELLRTIVEQAAELVQGTGGGVYLWNEADETFRLEAVYGLPSELEGVWVERDGGVIGQVLRTKQPVAVVDFRHWSGRLRILDEHKLTAVVGAPIISGDRFLGAIAVHDTSEGRAFGEAEKELLHRFGNHAAVAIENARLFAETSRQLEELNRLYEGSQVVVSPLSLDAVLARIVELAGKVAGSDHTGVVLVGEDGRLVPSIEDHKVGAPLHIRARPGGITRKVIATGRPELFDNVVDDGRHNPIIIEQGFKSYAAVPIVSGGKVLGVLFVYSFHPHAFTQRVPLLTLFASQAAIAIQNAQLHAETERRLKQLELLEEVKQAVDSVFDLQQVLSLVLRKGLEMVNAEAGSIMLVDNKTHLLKIRAWFGPGWTEEKKRLTSEVGTGIAGWVAEHKAACRCADVQKDSRFVKPTFDPSIRSLLAVPILSRGSAIGVLNADSSEVDFFSTEDERLLNTLAGQVAIAIEKAKLLGALQEIGLAIVQAQPLDHIMQLVIEKSLELIGFTYGWLSLINEQGKPEVRAATKPIDDSVKIDLEVDERSIPGWVAKTGQPLNVPDVSRDPRYRKFYADTRSELAVPLKTQRRVVGVLNVESTEAYAFDEYDMHMLAVLANQAAVAVENARRYEELERAYEELEYASEHLVAAEAVAWMGLFGSEWSHITGQKSSAIRNYVATLRDVWPSCDDEQARKALAGIEAASVEMQAVGLLPAALESVPKPVQIDAELLNQVRRRCKSRPDVRLAFQLGCEAVMAVIDREWLAVVLEKIVDNALNAMPDGGTLTVSSETVGSQVEIKLTDTGYGIPEEVRPYFLRQRVPRDVNKAGTGMGLLIAKFILRKYGGNLRLLWSEEGKGTALSISLPVATEDNE